MTSTTDRTLDQALDILSDGFFDNPVLAFVFPDESKRLESIAAWFRFWIDFYGDQGILVVDESGQGAALWQPPDAPSLDGESFGGLVKVVKAHNGEERGNEVIGALAGFPMPTERRYYLNGIAARRGARAQGIGARLLEPFLERSDAEDIPIYLESSNPRNLSFYLRYGFEKEGPALDLPGEPAVLQPMWRYPRAAR